MKNPKTGRKWKVYCGFPSNGNVSDFQPYVIRDIVERYSDEIEFVFPEMLCQRIFHDAARNGIVDDFLASDCDVLWQLDSDICPPKHLMDLLTMHGDKWQIAGAPYPVFMAQPGEIYRQLVFTVYKEIDPCPATKARRVAPQNCPYEGEMFVTGMATGCLLIKRELFSRLERPYFEFKYDPIMRQPIEGEDIGFILKLLKLDVQFFTDFSMVCKHYKNNIDLLEINNYAISYAQKCVNYQRSIFEGQAKELETVVNKVKDENKQLRALVAKMRSQAPASKNLIFR